MKLVHATAPLQEAKFVLIGVPEESTLYTPRSGCKKGPDAFRRVAYERCVFKRKGMFSSAPISSSFLIQKVHDYGNVERKKLAKLIEVLNGKIPILVGGDHHIITEVLKSLKDVTVIYFDAHPDVVATLHGSYGSALLDIASDLGTCIQVGVRESPITELKNVQKNLLFSVPAEEIREQGVDVVWAQMKKKVKGKVFVSLSMDVFDPTIAPGVTAPVPGGLDYYHLRSFFRYILQELDVVGLAFMDLSPSYDHDDQTTHLAVKLFLDAMTFFPKR